MRNRYVLLADLCLIPIAASAAFALRFEWRFYEVRPEFQSYVLAALVIKPVVFHLFGMYRRYWRYASVQDLLALMLATSASFVTMGVFIAGMLIYKPDFEFSRTVLLLDGLLTFLVAGGVRIGVRVFSESLERAREGQGEGTSSRCSSWAPDMRALWWCGKWSVIRAWA